MRTIGQMSQRQCALCMLIVLGIGLLSSCSSASTEAGSPSSSSGSTLLRSTPGKGGWGSVADIAVVLVQRSTDAELQAGGARLQHTEGGRDGVFMNPGVLSISYDYERRIVYVNLRPDVTEVQREAVIAQVKSAPQVVDVKFGFVEGAQAGRARVERHVENGAGTGRISDTGLRDH